MKMTLAELAKLTGGEPDGDLARAFTGAAGLAEAGPEDVSFLGNQKYARTLATSGAGCVFLPRAAKSTASSAILKDRVYVDDPQWAFAQVLRVIEAENRAAGPAGVHPRAEVHPEARLGANVAVGPFTVIERRAVIEDGASIGSNCFIGGNARVGKDCLLYPNVVVREDCVVGDRAIIHSGTVVGSDGFGFSTDPKTGRHRKIPQIGRVVVEDDVEIGSNVSIDRATVGETRIGSGTKIDNLVQIAHNVQIGRNCFVVSQVGIAGSTQVGNQVILAGQAGLVGHITIGDGAVITAQTGVMGDVEPKAILFGSPARPHREAMKLQALLNKLPEMYETLKGLVKENKENLRSSL